MKMTKLRKVSFSAIGVVALSAAVTQSCDTAPEETVVLRGTLTVPSGLVDEVFVNTLRGPTAMEFAPDGRLFVSEKVGNIRVVKNGVLLATPFASVPVDSVGERGLMGLAFDPAFATNHFVYCYYTAIKNLAGATVPTHNRISRFTANGDVAVAGS